MIKIMIADDESHCRERLAHLFQDYPDFEIIAEAVNGDEVIQKILSHEPDVVFLDINMPGISVFKSLSSLKDPPLIIFQTAYSEYAVNAYEINALDYLLKPVSQARLEQALTKIKKTLAHKPAPREEKEEKKENKRKTASVLQTISINTGKNIKIVPCDEIYSLIFQDGITFIYIEKERYFVNKYLNYYEDKLAAHFFRTSRCEIINLNFIQTIHPMFNGTYLIELKNGQKINLSRRRAKELKKVIDF